MDARAAESLLDVAEEASAGATGPDAKASLERLDERLSDLQEAMSWFVDAGRTDEALRVANSIYRFWITKQRFDEGAVWFDRVLASAGGDKRLRGKDPERLIDCDSGSATTSAQPSSSAGLWRSAEGSTMPR